MNIKKPLLIAGVATSVTLAGLASGGIASAATSSDTNGSSDIVTKIAQKFNLDKDDVQKVFDEERATHEAEREQKMEERLTQAVTDGKITSAQKDLIVAKHAEMKTFMDSLKDKTQDERHTLMKQKMDEMKTWATDNNIPTEYLLGGGHREKGHGGPNMGFRHEIKTDHAQETN